MVNSCPIPTAEEAKYAAILSRIEAEMHDKIAQAINQASELAASELGAIVSKKICRHHPKTTLSPPLIRVCFANSAGRKEKP